MNVFLNSKLFPREAAAHKSLFNMSDFLKAPFQKSFYLPYICLCMVLLLNACSVQRSIHPYSNYYDNRISEPAVYAQLQFRTDGTYLTEGDPDNVQKIYHNRQPLNVRGSLVSAPTWSKIEALENPYDGQVYIFSARVAEPKGSLAETYSVGISTNSEAGESLETNEYLSGDPERKLEGLLNGIPYSLRLDERWSFNTDKRYEEEGTVIHQYPGGSLWRIYRNGEEIGEIVHGRYIRETNGKRRFEGNTYTLQIIKEIPGVGNPEYLKLLQAFYLTDRMYAYHITCDPSDNRKDRMACTEETDFRLK